MNDWDGIDRRRFHRKRWRALLVWCILFTLLTFVALVWIHNLADENEERLRENRALVIRNTFLLKEIQASRVFSCIQNYRTMQAILRATAVGRDLTPAQQKRLNIFLSIADPGKCPEQVRVQGGP